VAGLGKVVKETTNISAKRKFCIIKNETAQSMVLEKNILLLNRRWQDKLEFERFHE
jgi:hypothetical protein